MVKVLQFLMLQMEHLQVETLDQVEVEVDIKHHPNIPGGGGNGGAGVVIIAYPDHKYLKT